MHLDDTTLNAYADGSLAPGERDGVEPHLATCAACRQVVADLRDILGTVGELELREPPVRVWSRLERAIKAEREHAAPGARGFQPSGNAGARRNSFLAPLARGGFGQAQYG